MECFGAVRRMILCVFIIVLCDPLSTSGQMTNTSMETPVNQTVETPYEKGMRLFEEFLQKSVDDLLKIVLPQLVKSRDEAGVSPQCTQSIMKMIYGIKKLKSWAMRMLDASGKPMPGFLDGAFTSVGSFDECINVVLTKRNGKEDFRGKYCTLEVGPPLGPPPKNLSMARLIEVHSDETVIQEVTKKIDVFHYMPYSLGLCVPSTCSEDDVRRMAQMTVKEIGYVAQVPPCYTKKPIEPDSAHIGILSTISVLLCLVLIGTILDCLHQRCKSKTTNAKPGVLHTLLSPFSLWRNYKKLVDTNTQSGDLRAIHGIRVITMSWIVLCHTYAWNSVPLTSNAQVVKYWFNDFAFQAIHNAWLAVDTFFLIGGLLASYTTLQSAEETNKKFNGPLYVLRRYGRLTPSLLFTMGFIIFIPWMVSGPFSSDVITREVDSCYSNWWTNVLYINSWTPIQTICGHTMWYLGCDFEMHVLSAIVVYFLCSRKVVLGVMTSIIFIVGSVLSVAILTYVNDYTPSVLVSSANEKYILDILSAIHIRPYTHLGPYGLGLLLGYVLRKYKNIKISRKLQIVGWSVAFVLAKTTLYGPYEWTKGNSLPLIWTSIYAGTHRTLWAVAVGWVIFVCITGHGGPVNVLLTLDNVVILSRLTYCIYLLHGPLMWIRYGSVKSISHRSHYNNIYEFFANYIISILFALVCHLLVESPFVNLEHIFFKPPPKIQTEKNGVYENDHKEEISIVHFNNKPSGKDHITLKDVIKVSDALNSYTIAK